MLFCRQLHQPEAWCGNGAAPHCSALLQHSIKHRKRILRPDYLHWETLAKKKAGLQLQNNSQKLNQSYYMAKLVTLSSKKPFASVCGSQGAEAFAPARVHCVLLRGTSSTEISNSAFLRRSCSTSPNAALGASTPARHYAMLRCPGHVVLKKILTDVLVDQDELCSCFRQAEHLL